jgi:UDP-2,3-diacylglucosamine pyrophosphatase LpxH
MGNKNNFLFISDVHEPYSHHQALKFCKSLKSDFDIPNSNIYSVGDFADLYGFSRWPKSPNAPHTINQEIELTKDRMKLWYKAFPEMRICESNHDQRILRKALGADLPSQVIKSFEEIMEFPDGWQMKEHFIVCHNKGEFIVEHGDSWTSQNGLREAILHYGLCVVKGHTHIRAGVQHVWTKHQKLWGLDVGCLIDHEAHCFDYGKFNKQKSVIGCGLLLNGIPHFIPLV